MKAIYVDRPLSVRIADVDKPHIGDTEVLVRIISAGICGSDIGIYYGTNSLATYPRLIGHEYGGEVVEIGRAVRRLKIGDLVAIDPVRSCGQCYAMLQPGKAYEGHAHADHEEVYYLISGNGHMKINEEVQSIRDGDAIYIPAGAWHSIVNTGEDFLTFLAFSAQLPQEDNH